MFFAYLTSQNRLVIVQITGPGWIVGFAITLMKFMAKVDIYATNIRGPTTNCFLKTDYR